MAFSLSGSTITQSGTDTDLTGLASITGVTAEQTYNDNTLVYSIYYVNNLKLSVSGALTIDPTVECLIFSVNSPYPVVNVNNGGQINLGVEKTINGYTYQTKGTALVIPDVSHSACCAGNCINVSSGATLNLTGATIHVSSCSYLSSGSTVNIKNGVIKATRPDLFRLRNYCKNFNVDGLEVIGNLSIDYFTPAITFKGFKPQAGSRACEMVDSAAGGSGYPFIFRDYDSAGMTLDFSLWQKVDGQFINLAKKTDLLLTNQASQGLCQIFKEFVLNVFDTSNVAIQNVKLYLKDTNNGNRVNRVTEYTDYDITSDRIYQGLSDVNGVFPLQTVLTRDIAIPNPWDYRSESNDINDVFSIKLIHYNKALSTTKQNLNGAGVLNVDWILIKDTLLTEQDKTVVDGYTSIENANQFYDRAKSYLYDNYAGETSTIVSINGTIIDLGAYDLDIDANATSPFSLVGNKITIKSSAFTDNLTTTGIITLLNGATVLGVRTDANGTIAPDTTLTLTGLQTGSDVVILKAGTNTVLASADQVTGTTFHYTYSVPQSVDIGVIKQGYVTLYQYGYSLGATNASLPIKQLTDRNYQ